MVHFTKSASASGAGRVSATRDVVEEVEGSVEVQLTVTSINLRIYLASSTLLEPKTRFLLLSDSCGFVDVGRPLWREGGPLVYDCCWPSSAQPFSGPSPLGLMTIFYCLRFETPPTWRVRSPYLYPPGTGWPCYTPRHSVPFSSPPAIRRATVEVFEPDSTLGLIHSESESESALLYDWRFNANQFDLALSPLRITTRDLFFQLVATLLILCYNGSLVTWTVVSLTATNFKPLIFSVCGFTLSYTANMFPLPSNVCCIVAYFAVVA
jgi:hypothetical protein